jgi:hypothetical protein
MAVNFNKKKFNLCRLDKQSIVKKYKFNYRKRIYLSIKLKMILKIKKNVFLLMMLIPQFLKIPFINVINKKKLKCKDSLYMLIFPMKLKIYLKNN